MASKYVWGISGVIVLCLFSFMMGTLFSNNTQSSSSSQIVCKENKELPKENIVQEQEIKELSKNGNNLLLENNNTKDGEALKAVVEKLNEGFFYEASQIFQKIFPELLSEDTSQKDKNLKAMAILDTPESKEQVMKVIRDENADINLRQEIAREVNWQNNVPDAVNIINKGEEAMSLSVILAMGDSSLSESEKAEWINSLSGVFNENSSANVQIFAIDYLANNQPEKLKEINIVSSDKEVQQKVSQHLQELTQNR